MLDVLFLFISSIFLFVLPGFSLVRLFRLQCDNLLEVLFYSLSLSLTVLPILALGLSATVGVYSAAVIVAFLIIDSYGVLSIIRNASLSQISIAQKTRSLLHRRSIWVVGLAVILVLGLTLYNWRNALGVHSIDLGVHVYWAKIIIDTHRLPNYFLVEPLDQAVKYTYGTHALLAEFFITNSISIENYSWVPALVFALGALLGVALFTWRISKSLAGAIVAVILMSIAYHPGGYIQRGNLPDIFGYLLVISSLYSLIRVRGSANFHYALGLTSVSVIVYHQLATVILALIYGSGFLLMFVFSRRELVGKLRAIFTGREKLIFWLVITLFAVTYAGTVTYLTRDSLDQVATSGWLPYVQPIALYPAILGQYLFFLGIIGVALCLRHRTTPHLLLVAWFAALFILANGLTVGLPIIDPGRFVWRMTEPLAIGGGGVIAEVVKRMPRIQSLFTERLLSSRSLRRGLVLATLVIAVSAVGLQVVEGVSDSQRYHSPEPYYTDDMRVGAWLAQNATSGTVINNADVDSTATWVQTYSMEPHFIYKVSFGSVVAPQHYVQIYRDAVYLYSDPLNSQLLQIMRTYGIRYIVAHASEIPVFHSSPYFKLVFMTGQTALFESIGL